MNECKLLVLHYKIGEFRECLWAPRPLHYILHIMVWWVWKFETVLLWIGFLAEEVDLSRIPRGNSGSHQIMQILCVMASFELLRIRQWLLTCLVLSLCKRIPVSLKACLTCDCLGTGLCAFRQAIISFCGYMPFKGHALMTMRAGGVVPWCKQVAAICWRTDHA